MSRLSPCCLLSRRHERKHNDSDDDDGDDDNAVGDESDNRRRQRRRRRAELVAAIEECSLKSERLIKRRRHTDRVAGCYRPIRGSGGCLNAKKKQCDRLQTATSGATQSTLTNKLVNDFQMLIISQKSLYSIENPHTIFSNAEVRQ